MDPNLAPMKTKLTIDDVEWEVIGEALRDARKIQNFLWGRPNGSWGLEEWRRMFRKRVAKLDEVRPENPHASVELQKRLLQTGALSIALIAIIRTRGVPWHKTARVPSNLPQYKRTTESKQAQRQPKGTRRTNPRKHRS